MKYFKHIIVIVFLSSGSTIFSQEGLYSYGIQIKPMIPFKYFNPPSIVGNEGYTTTFSSRLGHSIGMVVRRGFTNTIALEFGINHVRRNFNISLDTITGGQIDKSKFGYVSYEIPVQLLFYVRLFDDIYMNGASGLSVNFFASSVETNGENELIKHFSAKTRWTDMALISNLGFEYRTEEKGFFYLGASFHLPFHNIAESEVRYDNGSKNIRFYHGLRGTYFTLDLRYFFGEHTKPVEKSEKKKKK